MRHTKAVSIVERLHRAVEFKENSHILNLYEEAKEIDWTEVPDELANEYDALVDKGNDLVLT